MALFESWERSKSTDAANVVHQAYQTLDWTDFDRYRPGANTDTVPANIDQYGIQFGRAEVKNNEDACPQADDPMVKLGADLGIAVDKELSSVISYVMFGSYRANELPVPNINPSALDYSKKFVFQETELVRAAWNRLSDDQRAVLRTDFLDGRTPSGAISPFDQFKLQFLDKFADFEKQRRT